MTRKELVKAVAIKRGVSQAVASDILDDVTAIIVAEVAAGNHS
jgi:nucleoid DNA-binding protein